MRRAGCCLVVTICALLASCGGDEDLPAMRNLGATTTAPLVRGTTPVSSTTTTSTTSTSSTTAPPISSTTTTSTTSTTTVAEAVPTALVATAASHVILLEAFREPAEGESWWLFPNPGPFDGPRVLLAADTTDPDWVQVHLPVRPNGRTGWVRRSDVVLSTVTTRIVVELGKRRVTVYDGSQVLVTAEATIGAPETPTPTGIFYVNQVQMEVDPDTERGAGLFGTSAFSEVLDIIEGGEPAVALHGTNQPELLGEALSRGCIRVADEVIELLMSLTLPLGTPVEILA